MHSAVRGPRPGIQGFLRMLRSPTEWRRVTWKRRQGASCLEQDLNEIEFTHIKMPIRICTYGNRKFNQVKYNHILNNIYIKMISET